MYTISEQKMAFKIDIWDKKGHFFPKFPKLPPLGKRKTLFVAMRTPCMAEIGLYGHISLSSRM